MRAAVLIRALPTAGLLVMVFLAACTTPDSVQVCFSVMPDGSVYQPHIKSASSKEAEKYLDKTALEAISKWKFFPKRVDGKPVRTDNVCQVLHLPINKPDKVNSD